MRRAASLSAVAAPNSTKQPTITVSPRFQSSRPVSIMNPQAATAITAAVNSYRDAVRFPNGREVRLQELREGQRVAVLDLSVAEELDLERLREERAEFTYRTR